MFLAVFRCLSMHLSTKEAFKKFSILTSTTAIIVGFWNVICEICIVQGRKWNGNYGNLFQNRLLSIGRKHRFHRAKGLFLNGGSIASIGRKNDFQTSVQNKSVNALGNGVSNSRG